MRTGSGAELGTMKKWVVGWEMRSPCSTTAFEIATCETWETSSPKEDELCKTLILALNFHLYILHAHTST